MAGTSPAMTDKGKTAMLRKILIAIVVLPLMAILVAFAVANRQAVTVSFDPFSATAPAYAVTLPLFAVVFIILILGVLIGGFSAWLRQGKWRRVARRLDADMRAVQDELHALRHHHATAPSHATDPMPPMAIPPPAA